MFRVGNRNDRQLMTSSPTTSGIIQSGDSPERQAAVGCFARSHTPFEADVPSSSHTTSQSLLFPKFGGIWTINDRVVPNSRTLAPLECPPDLLQSGTEYGSSGGEQRCRVRRRGVSSCMADTQNGWRWRCRKLVIQAPCSKTPPVRSKARRELWSSLAMATSSLAFINLPGILNGVGRMSRCRRLGPTTCRKVFVWKMTSLWVAVAQRPKRTDSERMVCGHKIFRSAGNT